MATDDSLNLKVTAQKPIPVARAAKYTPVKEGQQYPTGRGGQLKAFHEHVWPKGFSPERRREVGDVQLDVRGGADLTSNRGTRNKLDLVMGTASRAEGQTPDKLARAHVEETLARSTVPVEHLKKLKKTKFNVREVNGTDNPMSSFNPMSNSVSLNIKPQDSGADVSRQLIHEVGHAVDYTDDQIGMLRRIVEMNRPGADYGPMVPTSGNKGSHPVIEGVAEGYAAAHTRISNTQKKTGGDTSRYGYSVLNWKFPNLGAQFLTARSFTYAKETGQPYNEPRVEAPKQRKRADQPRLPGMEE